MLPVDIVRQMLAAIGDDPERDGLADTPARVVRSWAELYAGYTSDPRVHLQRTFEVEHQELIFLNGIAFYSTCEHHMLPFYGTADVAYLPREGGRVVGLSKLARVVDGYARRLQVQERLTEEIADAVWEVLQPAAVGVRVRAQHFCMMARGCKQQNATMKTHALRGMLHPHSDPSDKGAALRAEWERGLPG